MWRSFVYGTLKRGGSNHARFCQNAWTIREATLVGRLYQLPAGYPMLVVPAAHVLAMGTNDPLADLATSQRFAAEPPAAASFPAGDWGLIEGEILGFDDPAQRVPRWDALEDFQPGGVSHYHRVLLTTFDAPEPVWVYAAPYGQLPPGAVRLLQNRWE